MLSGLQNKPIVPDETTKLKYLPFSLKKHLYKETRKSSINIIKGLKEKISVLWQIKSQGGEL